MATKTDLSAVYQAVWQGLLIKWDDKSKKEAKDEYDQASSAEMEQTSHNMKALCEKFFKTKEYKSGDKDYGGYYMCCDLYGYCGMSGWIIFLIIVLVLGLLAAGAAAFWFFYWKRKY